MKRKLFCLCLLMFLFAVSASNAFAADIVEKGSCGDHATYTLTSDGTLTISGTGKAESEDFTERYDIQHVVIKSGITELGTDLFRNSMYISDVILPDSLVKIGVGAFMNIECLNKINLPASLTEISDKAFWGCGSLKKADIPNGVKVIGKYAFFNTMNLEQISIPDSVTSIGEYAFSCCISLTSVKLPKNLTVVSKSLFNYSTRLRCVYIPKSVTKIEWEAFSEMDVFTDIYYEGSKAEWEKISIAANENLEDAIIHFGSSDMGGFSPEKVTAVNTISGVRLTFAKQNGISLYRVYYKAANENSWSAAGDTGVTEFTIPLSKLKSGTKYTYVIASVSGKETGFLIDPQNYSGKTMLYLDPIMTEDIQTANTVNGSKVTWKRVEGADKYYIFRRTEDGTYKKIDIVTGNTNTTYTDPTSLSGTKYYYCVRAYSNGVWGSYAGRSLYCLSPILSSKLTVSNTINGAKVSFKKVTGAEGYNVYRRTTESTYRMIGKITDPATLCYYDKEAVSGTTYYYAVRAYHGKTLGSYSGKSIRYLDPILAADIILGNTEYGVSISWKSINGADGYNIYRREADVKEYTLIAKSESNSVLNYVDDSAMEGVKYYYSVRAYCGNSIGSYAGRSITYKKP